MFLTTPNLSDLPAVRHGFFTRGGGVSTGIVSSLNCGGRGICDSAENVDENRRRVAVSLHISPENLVSLYQVHSSDVITVTAPWGPDGRPEADAMVTDKAGIGLGILTADCVPVLFADNAHGVIGAAHAGWKGALAGVLERTLEAMTALGAQRASLHAAIGPAIVQGSYEVDDAFHDRFVRHDSRYHAYFLPSSRASHWQFDLKGLVQGTLADAGIASINRLENDTYMEEDRFFSYRRATHRGESDYGRHISVVTLSEK